MQAFFPASRPLRGALWALGKWKIAVQPYGFLARFLCRWLASVRSCRWWRRAGRARRSSRALTLVSSRDTAGELLQFLPSLILENGPRLRAGSPPRHTKRPAYRGNPGLHRNTRRALVLGTPGLRQKRELNSAIS